MEPIPRDQFTKIRFNDRWREILDAMLQGAVNIQVEDELRD